MVLLHKEKGQNAKLSVSFVVFIQHILLKSGEKTCVLGESRAGKFMVSCLYNYLLKLFDSPLTLLDGAMAPFHKCPLRWKRMVACKRDLGSGSLSFYHRFH